MPRKAELTLSTKFWIWTLQVSKQATKKLENCFKNPHIRFAFLKALLAFEGQKCTFCRKSLNFEINWVDPFSYFCLSSDQLYPNWTKSVTYDEAPLKTQNECQNGEIKPMYRQLQIREMRKTQIGSRKALFGCSQKYIWKSALLP